MSVVSAKLGGSASGILRYLSEEGDEALDYYGTGTTAKNGAPIDTDDPTALAFTETWGKSAGLLGIERGLTVGQFQDLYAGRWDGQQLVGTGYRKTVDEVTGEVTIKTVRTPMIDQVFGTPKSLAEFCLTADDETRTAVADAVRLAGKAAFEATERTARLARRGTGGSGNSERVTADLIAIPVVQFTARPTSATIARGAPPDPHIHIHIPIFTMCSVEDEKAPGGRRWLTADEYGLKNKLSAEHRDAVFMGELARQLEELGIELDYTDFTDSKSGRVTWEVKGSKEEVRRHFSSNSDRRVAMQRDHEKTYGKPMSDAALRAAMKLTRHKKTSADKAQDTRPNWQRWVDDARQAGLRLRTSQRLDHAVDKGDLNARVDRFFEHVYSPNGLCRDDSVFTAETIPNAVARAAVGLGFSPEELAGLEAILRRELVPVRQARDEKFAYFTTETVLQHERYITEQSSAKAEESYPAPDPAIVQRVMGRAKVNLDTEQVEAVVAACNSSGWVHIEGFAGTGKTTALKVVVDAHRQAKTVSTIVAISTAANTAERIGQKLGADRWGSVESFLRMVKNGSVQANAETLIVIDEAAMMDTTRMAELLKAAGKARFVLVGDSAQLAPIGAGGWYSESVERHGSVMLTNVHRHRDMRDVRDYSLIRDGETELALENLAMRDRVHVSPDAETRVADIFAAYKDFREKGYSSEDIRIVADSSNHFIDTLNRFVQMDLQERGDIRGEGIEVVDRDGDRRWMIHERDQVMFLRSYIDGTGLPIRNGETGKVIFTNPEARRVTVLLDSGRKVVMPLLMEEQKQPLGLAYAQHASKLQGGETAIVLVAPGTEHSATANSGYSQVTRATHEAHIYLDNVTHGEEPIKRLASAWANTDDKFTAHRHIADSVANFNIGDPETAAKAHEVRSWLVEDHGHEVADKITTAEGYVALVVAVHRLEGEGLDARSMLADAVTDRSLADADDTAAVLTYRITEKTPQQWNTPADNTSVTPDWTMDKPHFVADPPETEWWGDVPSQDNEMDRGISF